MFFTLLTKTIAMGSLCSFLIYPLFQVIFNRQNAQDTITARIEIYNICKERQKTFYSINNYILCIKIYLLIKKSIRVSFNIIILFKFIDSYFFHIKKKNFLISWYPTLLTDLFKTLYVVLNKMFIFFTYGSTLGKLFATLYLTLL